MSVALRGSSILSTEPCAADVASLASFPLGSDASILGVTCIDASGALTLFTRPLRGGGGGAEQAPRVLLEKGAVCQVYLPALNELWVGRNDRLGISVIDVSALLLPASSSASDGAAAANTAAASHFVRQLDAQNDIVTHMCQVDAVGGVVVVVSVGTQGRLCAWRMKESACATAATAPSPSVFAMCAHPGREEKGASSPATIWLSDAAGTVAVLHATTLQCLRTIDTTQAAPVTCLVSLPHGGGVWGGTENGKLVVFSDDFAVESVHAAGSSALKAAAPIAVTAMCTSTAVDETLGRLSGVSGRHVWVATSDGAVRLWNTHTEKLVFNAMHSALSLGDAANGYTCALLSVPVPSRGSTARFDEMLVAGGTTKIVTAQVVVVDFPSQSPVRAVHFAGVPPVEAHDDAVTPATASASAPARPLPSLTAFSPEARLSVAAPAAVSVAAAAPPARSGSVASNGSAGGRAPFIEQEQLARSEAKVHALMKRVAELELDLMQAQAIGAELTKRILAAPAQPPPQPPVSVVAVATAALKESSPSPARSTITLSSSSAARGGGGYRRQTGDAVPKVSVGVQVESAAVARVDQAQAQSFEAGGSDLADRVDALSLENDALRDKLLQAETRLQEQEEELSHLHEAATRPMDDYELRCMQRLILENEKLRGELSSVRSHSASQQQMLAEQQQATEGGRGSSNTLTVCFLTLRSVLGHHLASQIVLAAIGDQEENGGDADDKTSEVESIEKLVYELATRVHPSHRKAPDEL